MVMTPFHPQNNNNMMSEVFLNPHFTEEETET